MKLFSGDDINQYTQTENIHLFLIDTEERNRKITWQLVE